MRRQLSIDPNSPFKSSRLATPPSPFSPQFPITHPIRTKKPGNPPTRPPRPDEDHDITDPPATPRAPLGWLWQCHICHRVYRLNTTRRCLDDGHYFCAGTTTVKKRRRSGTTIKVVRHKACASEFDYSGWKAWGEWRRDVSDRKSGLFVFVEEEHRYRDGSDDEDTVERIVRKVPNSLAGGAWSSELWSETIDTDAAVRPKKDCWNKCDYPSECRWAKQGGVTPSPPPPPPPPPAVTEESSSTTDEYADIPVTKKSFDEILADLVASTPQPPPLEVASSQIEVVNTTVQILPEDEPQPTEQEVLASVKRRNRISAGHMPSPLASHPPAEEVSSTSPEQLDFEVDMHEGDECDTSHDDEMTITPTEDVSEKDSGVGRKGSISRGGDWVLGLWGKGSRG